MAISDKNVLSYTSQDYQSALEEIMKTKKILMPEYTDDTDTDFGNLILTFCAMLFDILSNKLDYSVNEAIPMLSETIKAMYKHCKWIGYKPQSNKAASAMFEVTIINVGETQTLQKGSQITMPYMVNNSYVIYEVAETVDCTAPEGTEKEETYKVQFLGIQGESVTEELGVSNGKEDQDFFITYYPYVEGSLELEVKDMDTGRSTIYAPNENNSFVNTNANDRIIVLEYVDAFTVKIRFGDGYNGQIPPEGMSIIAHYRIGGGAIGNRPANTINTPMFDMPSNFISVTNITDAKGGEDAANVTAIKREIEKGRHRIIYSLMRYQDYNNYLSKPHRAEYIECFKVCRDNIDITRKFRPIAIYLKPKGSFTFPEDKKEELLKEMNEYKLIDDEIHLYDVTPIHVKIFCKVKSDGLTVESQLQGSIQYAILNYVESLDIGGDYEVIKDIVGLYADDIRNEVRNIEGVRRFISMDFLDMKYPTSHRLFSKTELSDDVYDMVLQRGQKFAVENVETDIKVEFV